MPRSKAVKVATLIRTELTVLVLLVSQSVGWAARFATGAIAMISISDASTRRRRQTAEPSGGQATARPLFAPDSPISDLDKVDYFGHRAFSAALAEAVVRSEPPFTIALTGPWGTGKTSIAHHQLFRFLAERAKELDGPIAAIYFDVWKYEDALRREFLREVAEQLKSQGFLDRGFDTDRELEDLVVESSEQRI